VGAGLIGGAKVRGVLAIPVLAEVKITSAKTKLHSDQALHLASSLILWILAFGAILRKPACAWAQGTTA